MLIFYAMLLYAMLVHVGSTRDSCSLAPAVDLLSYSQREWKGNTTKSALIKQVGTLRLLALVNAS